MTVSSLSQISGFSAATPPRAAHFYIHTRSRRLICCLRCLVGRVKTATSQGGRVNGAQLPLYNSVTGSIRQIPGRLCARVVHSSLAGVCVLLNTFQTRKMARHAICIRTLEDSVLRGSEDRASGNRTGFHCSYIVSAVKTLSRSRLRLDGVDEGICGADARVERRAEGRFIACEVASEDEALVWADKAFPFTELVSNGGLISPFRKGRSPPLQVWPVSICFSDSRFGAFSEV